MKICIVGAGAMGCLYGGCLSLIGHDITLVGGRSIPVIREKGLKMNTAWTGPVVVYPKACNAEELEGEYDLLILLTKTFQSRAAMDSVRHILNNKMTVLSLQNGLGNKELLQEYVATEQIMLGMTLYPSDLIAPGEIVSSFADIGALVDAEGPLSERTRKISAEMDKAGIKHIIGEGAWEFIWEKVIFNASANTVCALMGVSSEMLSPIGAYDLLYQMADEGVAVANANGIPITGEGMRKRLFNILELGKTHAPSMLVDITAGRKTEVDFINGGLAREGRRLGIPTPINDVIIQLIHLKENSRGKEYISHS
ncbi:ketopantoate reductase family protein [Desulfitobacterium chlororespirans]|uniref:2-dehydropantoate 2-reductase n=1 Tax=Desulfitobacterium chlororespirans DSM 11544 TaxID=1121395 RepID=A0A1M7U9W7_9FIRM|nr:2-dehydropantoate 2-reductase [Desulfitobacterium chlororespirans]SHN79650.1 2-dehydropantoate 2-reductase [Desulfitobacterium chlororespirans DSM 11544]